MEKAMEAFGDPAEVGRELKQVHGGTTKRDALLAALPPVLLGMSMAIPSMLRSRGIFNRPRVIAQHNNSLVCPEADVC